MTRILSRVPITNRGADGATQHAPLVAGTVGSIETQFVLDTGSEVHTSRRSSSTGSAGTAATSWPLDPTAASGRSRPMPSRTS